MPPNPSNPVYTLALLPLYNVTNDVDGARVVREQFYKRIQGRHYRVMPLKEVDRILSDRMGITLGSQLEMTDPETLGETLGVDGILYGYLLDFDDVTTGVYNVKRVRAGFKLVHANSGRTVWSGGLGVKFLIAGGDVGAAVTVFEELKGPGDAFLNSIEGLKDIPGLRHWVIVGAAKTEKIGDAAALALGTKIITEALGIHLRLETDVMLKRLLATFPAGPGFEPELPVPEQIQPLGPPGPGFERKDRD